VNASAGSLIGINFALPKANALFYGRITDVSTVPLANLDFSADDGSQCKASGFSNTNGFYGGGVFAAGDSWFCSPANDNSVLSNYIVSSGMGGTKLAAGHTALQNFTVLPANAQIAGQVLDSLGHRVVVVVVNADATTNVTLPLSNWSTLLVTNLSGSTVFIHDNQATNATRFCRARFGP
jgi:hypothetical protein